MSRTPTPLHVLEARGSVKKNPQRYRERQEAARNAPPPEPIGPPPDRWMVEPESSGAIRYARYRALWQEFGSQITRNTPMRRALLEQFVVAMDNFRQSGVSIKASEMANLLALTKAIEQDQISLNSGKSVKGIDGQWEEYG